MRNCCSYRFVFLFILIGSVVYGLIHIALIREHLIVPFTVGITQFSAWLIQLCGGQVWLYSNTLSMPGFALQILDSCNGLEASIILWAAILAFPAPWSYKFKGLIIGTLAIQSLNILRIISLLYLGAYQEEWFDGIHQLWSFLMMLDIVIVFLIWIRCLSTPVQSKRFSNISLGCWFAAITPNATPNNDQRQRQEPGR